MDVPDTIAQVNTIQGTKVVHLRPLSTKVRVCKVELAAKVGTILGLLDTIDQVDTIQGAKVLQTSQVDTI